MAVHRHLWVCQRVSVGDEQGRQESRMKCSRTLSASQSLVWSCCSLVPMRLMLLPSPYSLVDRETPRCKFVTLGSQCAPLMQAFKFSIPMKKYPNCDFSFAGLKTSVRWVITVKRRLTSRITDPRPQACHRGALSGTAIGRLQERMCFGGGRVLIGGQPPIF